MKLTNRAFLTADGPTLQLLRHPSMSRTIVPFILHAKRSNWDTGEPWWNPRAIRYLKELLPTTGIAFEWGSGGSTVWLSNHGLAVTAIESELEWAERVRKRCPRANVRFIPGTSSGKLRSEPQLRDHGKHFFDDYVGAIDEFPAESLDIVVVDGICRVECAHLAAEKVKPNGIVVADDTNWEFLKPVSAAFKGWKAVTLSGLKPKGGLAIYSTTFFHKRGD